MSESDKNALAKSIGETISQSYETNGICCHDAVVEALQSVGLSMGLTVEELEYIETNATEDYE